MSFQPDPTLITWRLHLRATPGEVYALLVTDAGRARFWTESAFECGGAIDFTFPGGLTWRGAILAREPGLRFQVVYYGGSITTFTLADDGAGGTDLTLTDAGVPADDRAEVIAGWVSVLLALKAAADFGVDTPMSMDHDWGPHLLLLLREDDLGLTPPLEAQATPFHDRPFTVIHGARFATALVAQIDSAEVRDLATRRLIGNLDQWSDSTALRADPSARPLIRALYQARAPITGHAPAPHQPVPIRWVWFDVGETLIDERRQWAGWADWLGVTHLTFFAALGAVIAQRQDHRAVFQLLRPGFNLAQARAERVASGSPEGFDATDLYPDVAETLGELRAAGLRIGIAGNQPAWAEAALATIGLPADLVAASERWGVHKPDPAFFTRLAAESGVPPAQIAYVGDRLDNDVLPARAAGMRAIFLRRGPWGHIHATWPERAQADATIESLRELPALLQPSNAGDAGAPHSS